MLDGLEKVIVIYLAIIIAISAGLGHVFLSWVFG